MIGIRSKSGIRRKYLKYTIALLFLALFMSSVGVGVYVGNNMKSAVIDKYGFMTEKMGISLDNLYQKSDEVTAECIINDNVQNSLRSQELEEVEKGALGKYFAYVDLERVADYCYVDNKQNVYTRSYSKVSYQDFRESGFEEMLGGEYSKTKWFWAEDKLFGTGGKALFIGRYVRNMEYAHEPGMLFLKMDEDFLTRGVSGEENIKEGIATGIIDEKGQVCVSWMPEKYKMNKKTLASIRKLADEKDAGLIRSGEKVSGGVLSAYRQKDGGMIVYTFVPDYVLNSGLKQILMVLAGIYLLVIVVAAVISIYFSERFTKPIQDITEAMTGFDGNDFSKTIELHTNTELDEIGQSYNEMLKNIEQLLFEIKEQEKELRTSELNMLISQINPHFLYNTLDTIYMLARINKEETTMRMIQALSKYLRLSLSKGSDIVTVEDELENVKSYMEIQQIRNADLFSYEIDCQVDAKEVKVLKLILQPLVENAIKYGFQNIFEGGSIRIEVKEEEEYLVLRVWNNGTPVQKEMLEKLNRLDSMTPVAMKVCFPDKKHGYGVVNIVTRLRLKYGESIKFYYEVYEEGTGCVIKILGEKTRNYEK